MKQINEIAMRQVNLIFIVLLFIQNISAQEFPLCNHPSACNYSPLALEDDTTCCFFNCFHFVQDENLGLLNEQVVISIVDLDGMEVLNENLSYNGLVCLDDNNCYSIILSNPTDSSATVNLYHGDIVEYSATLLPGESLVEPLILNTGSFDMSQCKDFDACNFSGSSNDGNLSCCVYPGCDDPVAYNFNPAACEGDCIYYPDCAPEDVTLVLEMYAFNEWEWLYVEYVLEDSDGNILYSGSQEGSQPINPYQGYDSNGVLFFCVPDSACYNFRVWCLDDYCGGHVYWILKDSDNNIISDGEIYDNVYFGLSGTCGCTDSEACNYLPEATLDNASCCLSNCLAVQVPYLYAFGLHWVIQNASGDTLRMGNDGYNGIICADTCGNQFIWDGIFELGMVRPFVVSTLEGDTIDVFPVGVNYSAINEFDFEHEISFGNQYCGCFDVAACNYEPTALANDGNCCYNRCIEIEACYQSASPYPNPVFYGIESGGAFVSGSALSISPNTCLSTTVCLPCGEYELSFFFYGDSISWSVAGFDEGVISGVADTTFAVQLVDGCLPGCNEPYAYNYNPEAGLNDGSCMYDEAQFSVDVTSGCYPLTVNITSLTDVVPGSTCAWQIGDLEVNECFDDYLVTFYETGEHFITFTYTINDWTSEVTVGPITVYPVPVASMVETSPELVASDGATWQWYLDGQPIAGATEQNYLVLEDGEYSVEVCNEFGCCDSSSPLFITAIESSLQLIFSLNPNPMHESSILTLPPGQFDVVLIDEAGSIVSNWSNIQHSLEIKNCNYAGGQYVVRIYSSGIAIQELKLAIR